MADHVALLRAISVGGHGKISMSDLRAKFAAAGFKDAQTLLQSGNVVFTGKGKPAQMEKALEAKAGTDVLVRTASELQKAIDANPFPAEARRDPSRFVVFFLKEPPDAGFEWPGPERMKLAGRELYIVYPNGQG